MGHRGTTTWQWCHISCVCFKENILEVIWVGKEGLTDKIQQWETGNPVSPYATFSMLLLGALLFLLCKTKVVLTRETWLWRDWWCSSSTGVFLSPFGEQMQGCFSTLEMNYLFHQEEGLCMSSLSLYQQCGSCHGEGTHFCSEEIPWSLFPSYS